jgi:integrase
VGSLITEFLSRRSGLSDATLDKHDQALTPLKQSHGRRAITSLTVADAKSLVSSIKNSGLASTTSAKRLQTIKAFGQWLVDAEYLPENPFDPIKPGRGKAFEQSREFIPLAVFHRVLETVRNPEWRTLLVLARYGGLRIPSEIHRLMWIDIRWATKEICIQKAKTEPRVCPLFAPIERELRNLRESLEGAGIETPFVFGRWGSLTASSNLRAGLDRIVRRAGCDPWPRSFHNLRASRCTELIYEKGFTHKEVAKYMGNSPAVIMEHYEVERQEHLKKILEEE